MEPTDAELVRAVLSGDARAWGPLVERYKRLVYSIPRRYGLPEDACDDVFQNTFALFFRELKNVRDPGAITKWLMTTTHRESWKVSKGRRSGGMRGSGGGVASPGEDGGDGGKPGGRVGVTSLSGGVPELQEESPAEDVLDRWERQHLVHAALEKLGGRCEALLRAVFLERSGPSYQQIADRLGMPVGSIGPVRARCLERLSALLPKSGVWDT
jgi:RNA polymerase sigma factor (sigma-70 family)